MVEAVKASAGIHFSTMKDDGPDADQVEQLRDEGKIVETMGLEWKPPPGFFKNSPKVNNG